MKTNLVQPVFISQRNSGERGFNLMELGVVIATIAVLAVTLLPTLATSNKTSGQMQCISNLKQIGIALAHYVNDNNSYYPIVTYTSDLGVSMAWNMQELSPYLPPIINGATNSSTSVNPVFACPNASYLTNPNITYGASATMYGTNNLVPGGLDNTVARKATPMVNSPAKTILVYEGKGRTDTPQNYNKCNTGVKWVQSTSQQTGAYYDLTNPNGSQTHYLDFRHNSSNSMDVLYADYSVHAVSFTTAASTWTTNVWNNQ